MIRRTLKITKKHEWAKGEGAKDLPAILYNDKDEYWAYLLITEKEDNNGKNNKN